MYPSAWAVRLTSDERTGSGHAVHSPSPAASKRTGTNHVQPRRVRAGDPKRAATVAAGAGAPASAATIGATTASKMTRAEVGFPGRPMTGLVPTAARTVGLP